MKSIDNAYAVALRRGQTFPAEFLGSANSHRVCVCGYGT